MRAFGLVVRPDAHERVDHVSCECEFLSFLACKEAFAINRNDEAMRTATVRATTLFLRDHLGRFASAFARRLGRADPGGFYAALGTLLTTLVDADGQRLHVALGAAGLALRPDPATCAVPMGCGGDGESDACPALRDVP
jgi:TorA maturation chaperone TorD